ncbi:MAG: nucleotidyltransferase domain-containing protein [Alphaproteobacteria bacterium]|nr:nucleotidyltransferase domain-containing protein [Alphaproteobacteria bacterium]
MHRAEAIAVLQSHRIELQRLGVEHLYLFGSTARDEATPASDVDLFFDHPEGSLSLFGLMDIKETTASILGCKADIMRAAVSTPFSVKPSRPQRSRSSDGLAQPGSPAGR